MSIAEKKHAMEDSALDRASRDLLGHGFKCHRIKRILSTTSGPGAKPGIRGDWKGFPYVVYVHFIGKGEEMVALVVTRYKSRDWYNLPPHEIIKREG